MTTEQCQCDAIIGTINNVEVANMGRQDRLKGEWYIALANGN